MKKEKIVLSFLAVLIGILAAGIGFYLYQTLRPTLKNNPSITPPNTPPSPTQSPESTLSISSPQDETVVDTKTFTLSGKAHPLATIIISTQETDTVLKPDNNGNFSSVITLEDGVNLIEIRSYPKSGKETLITRTITYSTESF